jgi:hypothetical protein
MYTGSLVFKPGHGLHAIEKHSSFVAKYNGNFSVKHLTLASIIPDQGFCLS